MRSLWVSVPPTSKGKPAPFPLVIAPSPCSHSGFFLIPHVPVPLVCVVYRWQSCHNDVGIESPEYVENSGTDMKTQIRNKKKKKKSNS